MDFIVCILYIVVNEDLMNGVSDACVPSRDLVLLPKKQAPSRALDQWIINHAV